MITATPLPLPVDYAWDTGRGVRVPRESRLHHDPVRASLFCNKQEAAEFVELIWGMVVGPKCRDAFSIEPDTTEDGMWWVCLTGDHQNQHLFDRCVDRVREYAIVWHGCKIHQVINS